MGISLVGVGAKIAAATINALINAANATGLSLVAPSSVAGTGVTVSPTGVVSFTNATSASLNGLFSTQYDNYHIEITATGANASQAFSLVLRSAGTDSTAANYDYTLEYSASATASSATATAKNYWVIAATNPMTDFHGTFDIARPAIANLTQLLGVTNGYASASSPLVGTIAGGHRLAAAFDGFTLTWTAAMTGVIRVYGYNNG